MTGRLIRIDQFQRKGNDAGGDGGNGNLSTGRSTEELLAAAEQNYFDDGGRQKNDARIRGMMQVLLSDQEHMDENLRQAAEAGGLLNFPSSSLFPLRAESAIFADEKELREFMTEEMAQKYMADRRQEVSSALAVHCAESTRLMRDLTAIAKARMSGAEPGDILTPEHLRMALATEMVTQTTLTHIRDTRQKVQTVIAGLMEKSENGVKAAPLAKTMHQIGQLCMAMTQDLEKLSVMATKAIGKRGNGASMVKHTQVTAMTQRAREVFGPFVEGNHVISMEQLRGLESFLHEAGSYNENIGALIEDGIRAIGQATKAGRHAEAKKIEDFLGFDHQVEGFEKMARTLDRNFSTGASILAYAGASNRTILKSTPPGMLRQAEIESGLLSELLLRAREEELVLPAEDGLELG